jgi:hypothetical protein
MLRKCRVLIDDYADWLINKLDLKAELQLATKNSQDDSQVATAINNKRNEFIARIRKCNDFNLSHINSVNEAELEGLSDDDLKRRVFRQFYFLLDKDDLEQLEYPTFVDALFGYLVIVDSYLTADALLLYKQMLKFHKKKSPLVVYNGFFYLKHDMVSFIND